MNFPLCYKQIPLAFSQFTLAGTTQSIQLALLPPGATVWFVRLDLNTKFMGGTISSYTISVGDNNSTTKFTEALDVFRARAGNTFAASTLTPFTNDLIAGEAIKATAISGNGNLADATQGSATIHVYYTVAQ